MDENTHNLRNRIPFDFEDHFNYQEISTQQIFFARHYIENIMGIDLDSYSTIEFSSKQLHLVISWLI